MPAAVPGAIGEIPTYLVEGRPWLDLARSTVSAYFAYHLYLAYAEGIVDEAERGTVRRGLRGAIEGLLQAMPFVVRVLIAALIAPL